MGGGGDGVGEVVLGHPCAWVVASDVKRKLFGMVFMIYTIDGDSVTYYYRLVDYYCVTTNRLYIHHCMTTIIFALIICQICFIIDIIFVRFSLELLIKIDDLLDYIVLKNSLEKSME
ncbi:hypothetical protein QTP88_011047 [Uroleucon formosanum]